MELTVQRLIQQDNYNTIGNFIRFYNDYTSANKISQIGLAAFYRNYIPKLLDTEMTCVGLGLSLLERLDREFGPSPGTYLVSSEEGVEDLLAYKDIHPSHVEGTEKEHVMVCLRMCIEDGEKERYGVLLLDPGYHVARAITVMYDQKYPHTGWFTQCEDPWVKREFCYYFAPSDVGRSDYVVWETRETRGGGRVRNTSSLIYIGQPFLNPVEVTEKRNLVYEMRSWLGRNTKGEIVAGVYFPVRSFVVDNAGTGDDGPKFTLRQTDLRHKTRTTISFSKIYHNKLNDMEREQIERCNRQMGLYKGQLMIVLNSIAKILSDQDFVEQMLDINNEINCLAS